MMMRRGKECHAQPDDISLLLCSDRNDSAEWLCSVRCGVVWCGLVWFGEEWCGVVGDRVG
jgi:hypothetical protein